MTAGMTEGDGTEGASAGAEPEVAAFKAWLLASGGKAARTVSARVSAYRALLAADPSIAAGMTDQAFEAAAAQLADWQRREARPLPGLLAAMAEDRQELRLQRDFTFYEINPGTSSFGFGAEDAGGRPVGAWLVAPKAEAAYRTFHGEGSIAAVPDGKANIVLATLPFSMFASGGNADPAFAEVVDHAFAIAEETAGVLFRMDWTTAARMGLDPAKWAAAVAERMPGYEVRHFTVPNLPYVPMRGEDLFVGASRRWAGEFRVVAADPAPIPASSVLSPAENLGFADLPPDQVGTRFPGSPAGRIDADYWHDARAAVVRTDKGFRRLYPVEIQRLLGIPGNFKVPGQAETAYDLLGDSVAVPVAARAVRSFLRAVELA